MTANVDNIETKVREAEASMGIKSSDMISITYERKSEGTGRVMGLLLMLAIVALGVRGFQAMAK